MLTNHGSSDWFRLFDWLTFGVSLIGTKELKKGKR